MLCNNKFLAKNRQNQSGYVVAGILGLMVAVGMTTTFMVDSATRQAKLQQTVTHQAVTNSTFVNLNNSAARTATVTAGSILNPVYAVKDPSGGTPIGGGGYVPGEFGSQQDGRGNQIIYCAFFNGDEAAPAPGENEVTPITLPGNAKVTRTEIPRAPAYAFISPGKNSVQELTCDELTTEEAGPYGTYTRAKTEEEIKTETSGGIAIAGDDKFIVVTITDALNNNGQGAANMVSGLEVCDWTTQKLIFENTGPGGSTEFRCVAEQDPYVTGSTAGLASGAVAPANTARVFLDKVQVPDQVTPTSELRFRSLVAGNNISISEEGDNIRIHSLGGGGSGTITGAENVGFGPGKVFANISGTNLWFRSIRSADNRLSVETIGHDIVLTNTSATADLNGNNVGDGTGTATNVQRADIFKNKTIANNTTFLNFRRLQAAGTLSLQMLGDDTIQITGLAIPGPQGPQGPPGAGGQPGPQGPAGPAGNSSWTVSGNHQYSNNPGNVGIGTTNPVDKLHVEGNATVSGRLRTSNLLIESNSNTNHLFRLAPTEPPTEVIESQDPYSNNNDLNVNNLFGFWNSAINRHARIQVEKVYAYSGLETKHNGLDVNYFDQNTFRRGFKIYATTAGAADGDFRFEAKSPRQANPFDRRHTFAFKTAAQADGKYADIRVGGIAVMGDNNNHQLGLVPQTDITAGGMETGPGGDTQRNIDNLFSLYNYGQSKHSRIMLDKVYATNGLETKHNGIDINYFTGGQNGVFQRGMRIFAAFEPTTDADFLIQLKTPRIGPLDPRNTVAIKTMDGQDADLRVGNLHVSGDLTGVDMANNLVNNSDYFEWNATGSINQITNNFNFEKTGLNPGLWFVSASGTTFEWDLSASYAVAYDFSSDAAPVKRKGLQIFNHPDGSAPLQFDAIIRVGANGRITIRAMGNGTYQGKPIFQSNIQSVTAHRISN